MFEDILTAGTLTVLFIEFVKWLWRKFVAKDMTFDFPPIYYETMLPLVTFLWSYVLGIVGWGEPVTFDVPYVIKWVVNIFVALALYYLGVKPFKEYAKVYKAEL